MAKVRLASVSEVPEGGMTMREHDGRPILLVKIDGRISAMNDTCTHRALRRHHGEGLPGHAVGDGHGDVSRGDRG